jgi:hypothetical protein
MAQQQVAVHPNVTIVECLQFTAKVGELSSVRPVLVAAGAQTPADGSGRATR